MIGVPAPFLLIAGGVVLALVIGGILLWVMATWNNDRSPRD